MDNGLTFFYNESYQSIINDGLADGYTAYNFRETIQHEIGHYLGLLDYSDQNFIQRCTTNNYGIMDLNQPFNEPRQLFS